MLISNKIIQNHSMAIDLGRTPSALLDKLLRVAKTTPDKFEVTQLYLSRMLGCSTKTIQRALNKLKKLGYLTWEHSTFKKGSLYRTKNIYCLNVEKIKKKSGGIEMIKGLFRQKDPRSPEHYLNKTKASKTECPTNYNNNYLNDNYHHNYNNIKQEGSADTVPPSTASQDSFKIKREDKMDRTCNSPEMASVERFEGEIVQSRQIDPNRCVRIKNDGNSTKGHHLPDEIELSDRFMAALKKFGIHPDWSKEIFLEFCQYWWEEAPEKKAVKKNWFLTWCNWLKRVAWQHRKPMTEEEKRNHAEYYANLYAENETPEPYRYSLGMEMMYWREKKAYETAKIYGKIENLRVLSDPELTGFHKEIFMALLEAYPEETDQVNGMFKSWFKDCSFEKQEEWVLCKAPSRFVRDQINIRFKGVVERLNLIVDVKG